MKHLFDKDFESSVWAQVLPKITRDSRLCYCNPTPEGNQDVFYITSVMPSIFIHVLGTALQNPAGF